MNAQTRFPPVDQIVDRIAMRTAIEDYGLTAAALERIAQAADELGFGPDYFDTKAREYRKRQADLRAFLRGGAE